MYQSLNYRLACEPDRMDEYLTAYKGNSRGSSRRNEFEEASDN